MMAMNDHVRRAALLLALAATMGTRASAMAAPETKHSPCCFTNLRYAGVCQAEPLEDETCASILAYLNQPTSVGKSHCNSTAVRGGWKQTKCKS